MAWRPERSGDDWKQAKSSKRKETERLGSAAGFAHGTIFGEFGGGIVRGAGVIPGRAEIGWLLEIADLVTYPVARDRHHVDLAARGLRGGDASGLADRVHRRHHAHGRRSLVRGGERPARDHQVEAVGRDQAAKRDL